VLVYWVTANTWMLGQQFVFKQRIARQAPPVAVAVVESGDDGESRGAGIAALLRGASKPSPAPVTVTPNGRTAPPPSPRKKKKRSGRRR
jgi:membrane protein insertase Oxa1/YidC/SpoIIIJ